MKVKERWVITELKDEKNPDKVYYVSDIGRIMTKDLNRKKKRRIEFDPKKSNAKVGGYKYYVQRKPIMVRKLVYYSFNRIPLEEFRTLVSKDGDLFNVRLDNLEDRTNKDRIKDRINLGCLEDKVRIKWGQDELWIEMDFYNERAPGKIYYVSNKGRIGMIDKKADNKPTIIRDYENGIGKLNGKGYVHFSINKLGYSIHRLVASYFLKVPYNSPLQVHHINGIKHDNRLENLMWVNGEEHRKTEMETGLAEGRISFNKNSRKHSWDTIQKIRHMYEEEGMNQHQISIDMDIDHGTIKQIVKYETYKTQ